MVSPIIYSEILYDNKLENEIQYMFMPFNSMQYLFFLPKYKIYKNFISFNSFKVNVVSLIGIIIPTISFVFRTIKLLSLAYRNFYFVLFLCFDFCFYVSGFSVSYISNIVYKKENIELVLSIQRIFKMFKFKRYQHFLSCTVISWVTMYLIVIFFIIMNGLYLLLSKSYVLDTVTTFFFIYFNASVVYAGRILNIITIQLKLWISELNYLKAVNHRSHTVCKIQENYIIKSKRPNAPKKIPQKQENVIRKDWDRLLNIYRKILETYDLYKRTFQILILYHAVGTFVNTLIYVQIWIQYHNIDRVQHNPAKTRGWQISQIRICLWVVKDIIVNSFISFSSQVFYATVTKAQVECIRVLKRNQSAGAGARMGSDARKTCKNVIRLTNVSFTVTKACGLFQVDAVYLFQMYSSIASYALVLLQFAFLK